MPALHSLFGKYFGGVLEELTAGFRVGNDSENRGRCQYKYLYLKLLAQVNFSHFFIG